MVKVAAITPHLYPNIWTKSAVTIVEMAILTKLLPTKIAAITLSSFITSLCTADARFMPLATICFRRILFKPIIAVSATAKKKDTRTRIDKIKIINGRVNKMCIDLAKNVAVYG